MKVSLTSALCLLVLSLGASGCGAEADPAQEDGLDTRETSSMEVGTAAAPLSSRTWTCSARSRDGLYTSTATGGTMQEAGKLAIEDCEDWTDQKCFRGTCHFTPSE